MTKRTALAIAFLAACGGGDGDDVSVIDGPPGTADAAASDAARPDGPPVTFALTSTAFVEGGVIPDENACAGANTSPPLAWTPGPSGTMSYAVVFTDISPPPLVHWVIYDISATATGLPADVDKVYAPPDVPGAHQTVSYSPGTRGYLGPCPGTTHTYQFEVFALDVTPLPGATMATTRAQAVALIADHDLASATLTGTYTP
jgi:Raf kinase inhibitor-like YbhB/YbcL family protein